MLIGIILTSVQIHTVFLAGLGRQHKIKDPPNLVSITFDDGPHKRHTAEILDILKTKNVPATFFIIGNRIPRNENIIRRILMEGHIIGNHSYSHPNMRKLSTFQIAKQVLFTDIQVFGATGTLPTYFRFPYGFEDSRIGYFFSGPIIGWNVDAYDWKAKNPEILTQNIIRQTKSGSIILLHDIKSDTVAALPDIIDGIRAKGYRIVALKELLYIPPLTKTKNILYRSQKNKMHISEKKSGTQIPPTENIISALEPLILTAVGSW